MKYIYFEYNENIKFDFYVILIYFMVQSPSWEANWFAASQEIPLISRSPKVHFMSYWFKNENRYVDFRLKSQKPNWIEID